MYSSIYSSEQKLDQYVTSSYLLPSPSTELTIPFASDSSAKYNSVYSTAAEEIRQSGLWDGYAPPPPPGQGHGRGLSKSSGLRNELSRNDHDEYMDSQEYLGEYGAKAEGEKVQGDTYVSGYQDYEYGQGQGGPPPGAYGHDGGFRPPVNDSRDYEDQYEHQGNYAPHQQQQYHQQQPQRRY